MGEDLLKFLLERKGAMETGIFTHPPGNWDEYQKRLGRWSELSTLIDMISGKIKENDV